MAEAIPKAQQIFTAIKTRFATITTANGYLTNIGSHVVEWKATPWQEADLPGVDLREEDGESVLTIGLEEHKTLVKARCVVTGSATSADIRKIKADIITMVGVDATWGGLAEDTGLVSARPAEIKQAKKTFMGIDVQFAVEYTTAIHGAY